MAAINLSTITIPAKQTAVPGKDAYNQEMFYGVMLDLLALAKTAGFALSDQNWITLNGKVDTLNTALATLNAKLDALKTAIDGVSVNVSGTDLTNLIAELVSLKQSIESFSASVLAIADVREVADW